MRSGPYRAICRQQLAADALPAPVTSTTCRKWPSRDPRACPAAPAGGQAGLRARCRAPVDAATRQQFGTARHRQDRQTGPAARSSARRRSGPVAAGMATMRWVAPCSPGKARCVSQGAEHGAGDTGMAFGGSSSGSRPPPSRRCALDAGHQQTPCITGAHDERTALLASCCR